MDFLSARVILLPNFFPLSSVLCPSTLKALYIQHFSYSGCDSRFYPPPSLYSLFPLHSLAFLMIIYLAGLNAHSVFFLHYPSLTRSRSVLWWLYCNVSLMRLCCRNWHQWWFQAHTSFTQFTHSRSGSHVCSTSLRYCSCSILNIQTHLSWSSHTSRLCVFLRLFNYGHMGFSV